MSLSRSWSPRGWSRGTAEQRAGQPKIGRASGVWPPKGVTLSLGCHRSRCRDRPNAPIDLAPPCNRGVTLARSSIGVRGSGRVPTGSRGHRQRDERSRANIATARSPRIGLSGTTAPYKPRRSGLEPGRGRHNVRLKAFTRQARVSNGVENPLSLAVRAVPALYRTDRFFRASSSIVVKRHASPSPRNETGDEVMSPTSYQAAPPRITSLRRRGKLQQVASSVRDRCRTSHRRSVGRY